MAEKYTSGNATIQRFGHGFALTVELRGGSRRRLYIDTDGSVFAAIGEPPQPSELELATRMLPRVTGGGTVALPLQGVTRITPGIAAILRQEGWPR